MNTGARHMSIADELDNDWERDAARSVIQAWHADPQQRAHECLAEGAAADPRVADALAEVMSLASTNCATFESDFQVARAGCKAWQALLGWDVNREINR